MFESTAGGSAHSAISAVRSAVDASEVHAWAGVLAPIDASAERALSDADRIDLLTALEDLKAAACAAQARITAAFATSQEQAQAAQAQAQAQAHHHTTPRRVAAVGVGVAAQVALARRESPHRGGRLVGLARALVDEMPRTLAALESGRLNEWRATLIVRETACLSRVDRTAVDDDLWADPAAVVGLGDRALASAVKSRAYRIDPHAVVARAARAASERSVTLRPAPDTMTYLTALLPVAQGVAAYAALTRAADGQGAAGDQRGRGQIMADTLVERLTGQRTATEVPITVNLVLSDETLLAGGHEPATVSGYGPIPAGLARRLCASADARRLAMLRRLYTRPETGRLVGLDSRARRFPRGLADFLDLRDQTCRTPWCDAPIRHHDHVIPHDAGGATAADNGQGLCEACNYAKEAPGWQARPGPDGVVITTTPTGREYVSPEPRPPGRPPPRPTAPRTRRPRLDLAWGGPRLDHIAA